MQNTFEIESLDNFGRGISHINGKVIFIENALPNENVLVNFTLEKRNMLEGYCSAIIRKSPDRVKPSCPYYDDCGGCNIMHLNYLKQLEFKKEKVSNLLNKFSNIKDKVKEIIPSTPFSYRNKITLKVRKKVGLYKRKSYEIVDIDRCIIASDKINDIISKIKKLSFKGIEEIIIRSNYKDDSMIILKTKENIDIDYYKDEFKKITDSFIVSHNDKETVVFGEGYIIEKIDDFYFRISPSAFFQVNTVEACKLYKKVKEYANLNKDDTLIDLYCGTGTIGTFLSKDANRVIGIEINKDAIKDANYNKKLNSVNNIEFICKNVDLIDKDNYKGVSCVIIDPPRSGLSKKSLSNVLSIMPKKIVYVSCDPATLARDLNALKNEYEVKEITLVDMFPNTYHVETICCLLRKCDM